MDSSIKQLEAFQNREVNYDFNWLAGSVAPSPASVFILQMPTLRRDKTAKSEAFTSTIKGN